jgi:hypothetical protein
VALSHHHNSFDQALDGIHSAHIRLHHGNNFFIRGSAHFFQSPFCGTNSDGKPWASEAVKIGIAFESHFHHHF